MKPKLTLKEIEEYIKKGEIIPIPYTYEVVFLPEDNPQEKLDKGIICYRIKYILNKELNNEN